MHHYICSLYFIYHFQGGMTAKFDTERQSLENEVKKLTTLCDSQAHTIGELESENSNLTESVEKYKEWQVRGIIIIS